MHIHAGRLKPLGTFIGLLGLTGMAQAGGFALIEHGASGLGNAYAGAAAVSHDGSTVWFNPAGMSQLDGRELVVGLHLLSTNTDWTDRGTTLGSALGRSVASGPTTAEAGTTSALPNFYYVAPINEQWRYGLSIGAPYGSSTEYDANWKGRYTTVKSGISVIDINPALSYTLSDKVSLGFGVSLQQLKAELGSAVDSGAACFGLAANAATSFTLTDCVNAGLTPGNVDNDGYGEISGDSTTFGFNLGALFTPNDTLKIGVAYRHSTKHELKGNVDFTTPQNLQDIFASNTIEAGQPLTSRFLSDTGATAEVDLPATFSVSAAWQANNKVELLGDITWTGWSSFKELRVVYDTAPLQPDTLSVQEWEDVMRYSAGVNYAHSDKLTLRAGLAYDQEAIPDPTRRTARIPGNDRTWLSVGGNYELNQTFSFDLGYSLLMLDKTPIDNSDPESEGAGQEVRGTYNSSVHILGAQLNWSFN